jgi:hypothetical protein
MVNGVSGEVNSELKTSDVSGSAGELEDMVPRYQDLILNAFAERRYVAAHFFHVCFVLPTSSRYRAIALVLLLLRPQLLLRGARERESSSKDSFESCQEPAQRKASSTKGLRL